MKNKLHVYNHTNHLGNIRISYTKVDGVTKVLEENNYYAFGLKHQNYNSPVKKLTRKVSDDTKSAIPAVENPYNYKYNGKELQDELGLNWYDYGARNYDASLGRWMNIDPLSEEYDSWSPYNYALNNPVIYIDPDGRGVEDVIILYNDENGKQQRFRYNGTNGADAPDNAFVNSVLEASCGNSCNGGGNAFDTAANDSSTDVYVMETDGSSSASSRANGNSMIQVVQWNPSEGNLNENGDVLSPATVLEHEVDHAYDKAKYPDAHNSSVSTKDSRYDNKEERRVITVNETMTARANGEISKSKKVSRNNHSAGKGFKNTVIVDGGPTSTKVNKKKSAQHRKKLIRNQTSWSSEY